MRRALTQNESLPKAVSPVFAEMMAKQPPLSPPALYNSSPALRFEKDSECQYYGGQT